MNKNLNQLILRFRELKSQHELTKNKRLSSSAKGAYDRVLIMQKNKISKILSEIMYYGQGTYLTFKWKYDSSVRVRNPGRIYESMLLNITKDELILYFKIIEEIFEIKIEILEIKENRTNPIL